MSERTEALLMHDLERLRAKGLYGASGDSFSMRIPGTDEFLLATGGNEPPGRVHVETPPGQPASLHALLYRDRPDAGALLLGRTDWSSALATIPTPIPVLFDEQARHIGAIGAPIGANDADGLRAAVSSGANIAIVGEQRLCLGATPDRIVFNAELFEKCATAWIIARSSGQRIHSLPRRVVTELGERLAKDQARAATSLAAGRIPEGMNAY